MKKKERSIERLRKSQKKGDFKKGKADEDQEPEEEYDEVEELNKLIQETTPAEGTQPSEAVKFADMALSSSTKAALAAANYVTATEIQAACIGHALAGRDILGAAKTGSGKTLAFVVPLIEKLFREKWSFEDGLAAIIITPTRELALQIFQVIRTVGLKHQLSAGVITGGKKGQEEERERVVGMNILVATPGRLLQHLEQTPGFDASQLQVLVLDEADRILDLGFRQQLDQILEYLPPRQTLLFSATQTKSVKDLARLSLNNPQYLSVHEHHSEATPSQLVQNYIVCNLQDKLDILFSFIKTHIKHKMIVFLATCSQVRFVYECFCSMQPGVPLTALHGKLKQEKRTLIYMEFLKKTCAVMFATDLAARGLDFPNVDWVIQMDAPEDSAMYIHRVGRTARYTNTGRALLMLTPSEEGVIQPMLSSSGIPIKKLTINPKYTVSVGKHAAALLVAQPECKALAKKAFVSYLRSLQLMPQKEIAESINSLPLDEFASSLGLAFTPLIPTVATAKKLSVKTTNKDGENDNSVEDIREQVREKKNVNWSLDKLKKQIKAAKEEKKKLRAAAASSKASSNSDTGKAVDKNVDDDDDLFEVKATYTFDEQNKSKDKKSTEGSDDEEDIALSMSQKAKKKLGKLKIRDDDLGVRVMREAGAKKITFGDDGEVMPQFSLIDKLRNKGGNEEDETEDDNDGEVDQSKAKAKGMTLKQQKAAAQHALKVKSRIDAGRKEDYERDRLRIKEKHKEQKAKLKANRQDNEGDGEEQGVMLASPSGDYDYGDSGSDGGDNDHDNESDYIDGGASDDDEEYVSNSKKRAAATVPASNKRQKQAKQKRSRRDEVDDSDGGSDGDNDLSMQEQLALKMLG